jgi:chromosome segregation ATPase
LFDEFNHQGKLKEKRDKEFDELQISEGELRNENRRLAKENKEHHRSNLKLTNERDHTLVAKKEAEHQKNITTAGVNALTREIEYLRKTADNEKTDILNLIRDRDMMSKYIRKAEEINEKNKQEIIKLNAKVASLNEQSRQKAENIASLISQLFKLEKERDKAA